MAKNSAGNSFWREAGTVKMDRSSTRRLCRNLIGCAVRRCRMSENLCRLSIFLKLSLESEHPIVRITISDTGIGSGLEFKWLDFTRNWDFDEKWDGVLSITTTSISDEEIYHYYLNLKEHVASKRLTRLPSSHKHGRKFSGTEISLCTYDGIDDLVEGFSCFLQKMAILKIPKVAVELVVDQASIPGSRCDNLIFASEYNANLASPMSNIKRLTSGFKDHVLKHGNVLDRHCQSCFSSDDLKIGEGTACGSESLGSIQEMVEAVIIITKLPESSSASCMRASSAKTEIFYFQDFFPCSIPQSFLNSLMSIDWKSFGLSIRSSVMSENCHAVLEWENLPPYSHIDIAIHCYHNQSIIPPVHQRIQFGRNLVKKAVKFAMDDLKAKNAGILLSAHALKIQSCAPDLAKTVTGLILSSNDLEFQEECISLLRLTPHETGEEKLEDTIREKIIAVIQINDRNPQRSREPAPFLFEGKSNHDPEFEDDEEPFWYANDHDHEKEI